MRVCIKYPTGPFRLPDARYIEKKSYQMQVIAKWKVLVQTINWERHLNTHTLDLFMEDDNNF